MNYQKNTRKVRKVFPKSEYATVRRGDIYYADLSSATVGSEQGGTRPVLIIQNNKGNIHSPTVIAAAITSQNKRGLPTHIELKDETYGLSKNSTVMLEQIRTIDKTRLRDKIGHLDKEMMDKVNEAIFISFGIDIDAFKPAGNSEGPEEAGSKAPAGNADGIKGPRRAGAGMRKHRYNQDIPGKKKSVAEKYKLKNKYILGELENMKTKKEFKLRKANVSADGEKVKVRMVETWKEASAEAKRKVKQLAGANVYRIITRSNENGNISEGSAVALSWGLGLNPFYITGESDDKGEFSLGALGEFLKKRGYKKNFIEAYAKYLLSLENISVESVGPEAGPEQEEAFEEVLEEDYDEPETAQDIAAPETFEAAGKSDGLDTQTVADGLSEDEVLTLVRALLIRSKVKNSNISELAAQIKTLLLLN